MSVYRPKYIINVHAHHSRGRDFETHLAEWVEQGATRTCVLCMGPEWREAGADFFTNEDLAPWLGKHPDHVIGMAWVSVAGRVDGAAEVQRWHDQGFRGLKMICPDAPYDDPRYYAIYERAQTLSMPILFHTGYVGGRPGTALYARTHSEHMRPWYLEHVTRRYPELRVIGAHLGKPHIHEALGLMEKADAAYFDFSGSGASRAWQEEVLRALWPRPGADWGDPDQHAALRYFTKLCFATDNPPVAKWYAASEYIMDNLRIPPDLREAFYWRNAAGVFGLEDLLASA